MSSLCCAPVLTFPLLRSLFKGHIPPDADKKIEPMKGVRVKKVGVAIVLFADENVQHLCIIKRTC